MQEKREKIAHLCQKQPRTRGVGLLSVGELREFLIGEEAGPFLGEGDVAFAHS